MKRLFAILAIGSISALPTIASAANAPASVSVLLPAGTAVSVHVVGQVSSSSAKIGDTFQIAVAQDVVLDGMIVIAKGAGGQGEIAASDSASGNGHSGSLGLKFDYVFAADGGKVHLADGTQTHAEDDRKGASSTATIVGFATLGLGGLFAHNFAHGRQKTIDSSTIVNAFVGETVHVDTTEHGVVDHYDK